MIYDLQKGSIWKRISAFLLDIILLSIVAVGVAALLSLIVGYDGALQKQEALLEEYKQYVSVVEEKYGVSLYISEEEYGQLDAGKKAQYDAMIDALNADEEAKRLYRENEKQQKLVINLTLIIVTGGLLVGYVVLEFVVPLLFKDGRTLGKKVFGLAVMQTSGVKVNAPILFIRTILGKFAIETMIPAYIVIMFIFGKADIPLLILLALIPIVNLIVIIATKNNSLLHDLLSKTVVVDFASQLIFNSEEEMIEYKTRVHREAVENAGKEYPFREPEQKINE